MKKTLKKASIATLAGIMAAAVPFTAMASEPTATVPDSSEQTEMAAEMTEEEFEAFLDELLQSLDDDTTSSDYSWDSDYNWDSDYSTDTISEAQLEQEIFNILAGIGTEIENALSVEQIEEINEAFNSLLVGVTDHVEVFLNRLVDILDDASSEIGLDEDTNYFEMSAEEEAIWNQMSEIYDAIDELEAENIDTWKKLYQNTTVDDIDEDFDESAFIIKSKDLTTDEKNVLLDQIEQEDLYQEQLSAYQDELNAMRDTDYLGSITAEEQAVWNKILTFYNRAYVVHQSNAELWCTIDEALNEVSDYSAVLDDLDSFINGLDTITDEQKAAAIADNNLVYIFNRQAELLEDSIYNSIIDESDYIANAAG